MPDVLFVTAGPRSWASSRMRGYWIAECMGADVVTWNEVITEGEILDTDIYIFQKFTTPEMVAHLTSIGKRVYWDVCDPSWWFQPEAAREIADRVTGIVAATGELAADLRKWSGRTPVVIPDCLRMEHFTVKREHAQVETPRFIWYGIAANRIGLLSARTFLERLAANGHQFEVTIFDERPDIKAQEVEGLCPVNYIKWSMDTENEVIAAHDIALVPLYPGPWGRVKSNNRQLTAFACGLPVTTADDYEELEALVMSASERQAAAKRGERLLAAYTIDRAARAWQEVIGA